MIDEEYLTRLKLWERPFGQKVVASIFLMPNFSMPPATRVVLEQAQRAAERQELEGRIADLERSVEERGLAEDDRWA